MENFQFDVIDLPNKKVEYIAQGLQAFAKGIAGGMTTYAKNLSDKAKERRKKENSLLKQYNEIEIYYRDQANKAIVEFGKTGGDVDQFKNEIMGLANQAIDARFQNATDTSLSSSQRQNNLNVEQGFFDFRNSGLLLSAKEEAVKKENEETLNEKNLGEQVGYDVSLGPGDITTEAGRELNQRVSMFLDLYNKGQADERTGFKYETVVENKNGIATKVLKLTDESTNKTYDINRNYQNTNSTIVDTPTFNLSQQLEESEIKIKGQYQDTFLLNKSIEEQKDNIPGYRTFVTRQYLNMSSIEENLKANIQGDMSAIVSQGTGAIVNYMHRQGYTDEEISKVLKMPTNKNKSEYLADVQEKLQLNELYSQIPNRPATEEEISMYEKLGVKLTERDGKPYVYGLDESISAQRQPVTKTDPQWKVTLDAYTNLYMDIQNTLSDPTKIKTPEMLAQRLNETSKYSSAPLRTGTQLARQELGDKATDQQIKEFMKENNLKADSVYGFKGSYANGIDIDLSNPNIVSTAIFKAEGGSDKVLQIIKSRLSSQNTNIFEGVKTQ